MVKLFFFFFYCRKQFKLLYDTLKTEPCSSKIFKEQVLMIQSCLPLYSTFTESLGKSLSEIALKILKCFMLHNENKSLFLHKVINTLNTPEKNKMCQMQPQSFCAAIL